MNTPPEEPVAHCTFRCYERTLAVIGEIVDSPETPFKSRTQFLRYDLDDKIEKYLDEHFQYDSTIMTQWRVWRNHQKWQVRQDTLDMIEENFNLYQDNGDIGEIRQLKQEATKLLNQTPHGSAPTVQKINKLIHEIDLVLNRDSWILDDD